MQPVVVEVIVCFVRALQMHCLARVSLYASVTAVYGCSQAYKENKALSVEHVMLVSCTGI